MPQDFDRFYTPLFHYENFRRINIISNNILIFKKELAKKNSLFNTKKFLKLTTVKLILLENISI